MLYLLTDVSVDLAYVMLSFRWLVLIISALFYLSSCGGDGAKILLASHQHGSHLLEMHLSRQQLAANGHQVNNLVSVVVDPAHIATYMF